MAQKLHVYVVIDWEHVQADRAGPHILKVCSSREIANKYVNRRLTRRAKITVGPLNVSMSILKFPVHGSEAIGTQNGILQFVYMH